MSWTAMRGKGPHQKQVVLNPFSTTTLEISRTKFVSAKQISIIIVINKVSQHRQYWLFLNNISLSVFLYTILAQYPCFTTDNNKNYINNQQYISSQEPKVGFCSRSCFETEKHPPGHIKVRELCNKFSLRCTQHFYHSAQNKYTMNKTKQKLVSLLSNSTVTVARKRSLYLQALITMNGSRYRKYYHFAVFIEQQILCCETTLPTRFTSKSKLSAHIFYS